MLSDAVVVGRTRPWSMLLAIFTMRKELHGFLFPCIHVILFLWGFAWRPFGPPELRYNFLTPSPHYAVGVWKRSFIFSVRPFVQTNLSRKRSFSKTLSTPEDLKMPAFRFNVDRKHFENEAFRKRWGCDNRNIPPPKFYPNTNPK